MLLSGKFKTIHPAKTTIPVPRVESWKSMKAGLGLDDYTIQMAGLNHWVG